MLEQLVTLTTHAEDQSSVPNTGKQVAHTYLKLQLQ